jgi:hypothetical protein
MGRFGEVIAAGHQARIYPMSAEISSILDCLSSFVGNFVELFAASYGKEVFRQRFRQSWEGTKSERALARAQARPRFCSMRKVGCALLSV